MKNGKKKNGKLKPQTTILYIFLLNMYFSEDVFEASLFNGEKNDLLSFFLNVYIYNYVLGIIKRPHL